MTASAPSGATCNAPEGCSEPVRTNGLCNKHALRLRRRGTLDEVQPPADEGGEFWRPVPGYEGLYLVSSHGRVWSAPRPRVRGGIRKLFTDHHGYKHLGLGRDGKQQDWGVHQLVMLAFAGDYPAGEEIRHLDGNPANNRWAPGKTDEEIRAAGGNLVYGTHARNMQDMVEHGSGLVTARETHCPKGHEYTPENTRSRQRGGFACKQCVRDYQREYQKEYRRNRLKSDPGYRDHINERQRNAYRRRKDRRDEAA